MDGVHKCNVFRANYKLKGRVYKLINTNPMPCPNIVWITLDSVRADHTTMNHYERDTTPFLQDLADEGIGFKQCFAHSKSTHPSSGAILTGTPPTHNTVGVTGGRLPDSVPTVAERFSEAGYHTSCLSRNSYVSSATGLNRGFDKFQWLASSTMYRLHPFTLARYFANIRKHSAGLALDTAKHASPFLMNETAKRWLSEFEADPQPFFFYLHYNEPHRPYYPPQSYLDRYTDEIEMSPSEAAEFAMDVHYNLEEIIADGCNLTDPEWDALFAMYDAEIAYTDYMIGELLTHIRSLDIGETIFVVTADHGELFGEHGLLSHKFVLDEAVTHVPLVIHGLDGFKADEDELVQHADFMKTLLDYAGADSEGVVGTDLRTDRPEFAVSQRGPIDFGSILAKNPSFDTSRFHHSTLTSLRSEQFVYQRSDDRSELLERPDETTDVSQKYPETIEELDEKLSRWMEKYGQSADEGLKGDFSGAKEKQLRDLGYLE